MYHVSAQGVDERMINVHYYYYDNDDDCTSLVLIRLAVGYRVRLLTNPERQQAVSTEYHMSHALFQILFLATYLAVVVIDVDIGLGVGVAVAVFSVVVRTQRFVHSALQHVTFRPCKPASAYSALLEVAGSSPSQGSKCSDLIIV